MKHGEYSIVHHTKVIEEDIPHIDHKIKKRIRDATRSKLGTEPYLFGKPLRQSLKGCRVLRVGDYRIVYRIIESTVHIDAVVHRSDGYKDIEKRLG